MWPGSASTTSSTPPKPMTTLPDECHRDPGAQTHIIVRLAAQIQDAPPVTSDRDDLGISMPRRGDGSELHDAINQMLGRR
jgi:hypothetical protein